MNTMIVPMASELDLSGNFDKFWKTLTSTSGMDKITNLLAIVGVALVAWALVKWAWDRRRGGGMGGGGNSGAIWGALLVGAILSSPSVLIPILLTFLDVIVNGAVKIWDKNPNVS